MSKEFGRSVLHYGTEERDGIVERLVRKGAPRDVASFALQNPLIAGHTTGAARNLLQLLTVDEGFVTVDDDTVAEFAGNPEPGDGFALGSAGDPWQHKLFATQDDLHQAVKGRPLDFIAQHERYLGRSVLELAQKALAAGDLELSKVSERLLTALIDDVPFVKLSVAGHFGDSGMGSPISFLHNVGKQSREIWANDEAARQRIESRKLLRYSARACLLRTNSLMTPHVAFDHRGQLWPFTPIQRNQDGIWASFLVKLDPSALLVNLPLSVRHDPKPRTFPALEKIYSEMPVLSEILLSLIITDLPVGIRGGLSMHKIAEEIRFVGKLREKELQDFITHKWINGTSKQLKALSGQRKADQSSFEIRMKEIYLNMLVDFVRNFRFEGFQDHIERPEMGPPMQVIKNFLLRFADTIDAWEQITSAAKNAGIREAY